MNKYAMRQRLSLYPLLACLTLVFGCHTTSGGAMSDVHWGAPLEPTSRGEAYARYIASVYLEQSGEYEDALREMERVPDLDAEAVTPTLRLIRAYLRDGDYDRALVMSERAVEQAPDRANLWIVLGEIYHQLERYEDAVEAFMTAIELNPDNILGYGALVELQENTNDLVAAIDIYKRLIDLSPGSAGLHYQLGLNLARINDAEAAIESLERALDLNPNLVRARYLLGLLHVETGDHEKSVAALQDYLSHRPDDRPAQEHLSGSLARLERFRQALAALEPLLSGGRYEARHRIAAMYLYLRNGEPIGAEQMAPPAGAPILGSLFKAMAREDQGKPHAPIRDALDAVDGDVHEECANHLNRLIYIYGADAMGEWLVDRLARYDEEAPGMRVLNIVRGRTLMLMERNEEAIAALEPLIAAHGPDREVYYYLAVANEALDRFEDTERQLKAALALDPDDPDLLNFLGYLYAEAGVNLDEAEELLERALAIDPENPYYLDSLGWVYYQRGEADKAIELIQRAIYGMESDDAVLRDHLGDAYLLKGDVKRAIAEWERAHRLDPTMEEVERKIEKQRGGSET